MQDKQYSCHPRQRDERPHTKADWFSYPASVSTRNDCGIIHLLIIIPGFAGHQRTANGSELFSLFPRAESGTAAAERSEPIDERPAALYPYRLIMHPKPLGGWCTADIRAVL